MNPERLHLTIKKQKKTDETDWKFKRGYACPARSCGRILYLQMLCPLLFLDVFLLKIYFKIKFPYMY